MVAAGTAVVGGAAAGIADREPGPAPDRGEAIITLAHSGL